MKKMILALLATAVVAGAAAQTNSKAKPQEVSLGGAATLAVGGVVKLSPPDLARGENIMQALSKRQSTRVFSEKLLSLADLSDMMWAANGINRADAGKRTAPSSRNRQDIFVYVTFAGGSFEYDHKDHTLVKVSDVDCRPDKIAPLCVIIVANTDDSSTGIDAGLVSQNISLFCSGVGLATVCRSTMDRQAVSAGLKLQQGFHPILNHPVGYFK